MLNTKQLKGLEETLIWLVSRALDTFSGYHDKKGKAATTYAYEHTYDSKLIAYMLQEH